MFGVFAVMGYDIQPGGYFPGYEDLRIPFTRDKQGQADKPDYDFTNMGLLFPQNDATEIVYITLQLPHAWKLESDLSPHIHYVQDEAQEPVFKTDYRCYENGQDPTGAFTTLTASSFSFTYTSGSILQIVSFSDIDMAGFDSVSAMCDFKVYRDDNVVTGDVLAKEFDVHYFVDTLGSSEEFTK